MDTFSNLLTLIFGSEKQTFGKDGSVRTETIEPNIVQRAKNVIKIKNKPSIVKANPAPAVPTPFPSSQPKPTPRPVDNNIEQNIRAGFAKYGKGQVPQSIEPFIPQFVQAAQKYPLFEKNPYLLPSIAVLETSAGQNITRPNNLLNWGVRIPENNQAFAQMTPQEVLDRAISGLGERSPYYKSFREADEFDPYEFANTYEPANPSYGENLIKQIQQFQGGY